MEKDLATLLDAAAFQAADMIGPATVLEGAGRHLLDRLDLTDPHRWAVTSAIGSITAARKSLQDAADALLDVVAKDGADMLAMEVSNGEIKPKSERHARLDCVVLADTIEVGRTFKREHATFADWQVVTPRMGDALRGRSIKQYVKDADLRLEWSERFKELWQLATMTATEVQLERTVNTLPRSI